jgi:hypothetical protein
VIPIAAGYLGLDWVKENAGFGMAFQTMPYLFENWGPVLAAVAGVFWFGLLFFAGITSSLAMGTPWMGFMEDEFNWGRQKSAWTFGTLVLLLGLPTVFFYRFGVFDQYDYWAGTVALVIFALAESIVFSWIFGVEKGWEEIKAGADLKLPTVYKYVMKYVTPLFLLFVFIGTVFLPLNRDWSTAFSNLFAGLGWELDNGSLIKEFFSAGLREQIARATDQAQIDMLTQQLFYINGARLLLTLVFVGICVLVFLAARRQRKKGVVQ